MAATSADTVVGIMFPHATIWRFMEIGQTIDRGRKTMFRPVLDPPEPADSELRFPIQTEAFVLNCVLLFSSPATP
jgi:hypothetical protein